MTPFKALMITAAVVGCAAQAQAFQEQRQGTGAPVQSPAQPGVTLNAPPAPAAGNSSGGTEVSVPGLGKLGQLPKLDFGLELLYGATETTKPVEAPIGTREEPQDGDLTIRGTVRHKF
jgi:hypothetical protein